VNLADGRVVALGQLGLKPGQVGFLHSVRLGKERYGPLEVAMAWAETPKAEAWFVASDEVAEHQTLADYGLRMDVEEAYSLVKRLLGLAYFWTGSANGVALQLWATWLLYAVLIDLTDAVAARRCLPFAALSVEMTYRSIYYFTSAHQQGKASDPVTYLAENADWLGIIKRKRKHKNPVPAR